MAVVDYLLVVVAFFAPAEVVDLVGVLALAEVFVFKGLVLEDLHPRVAVCLLVRTLGHRKQLPDLVLQKYQ